MKRIPENKQYSEYEITNFHDGSLIYKNKKKTFKNS